MLGCKVIKNLCDCMTTCVLNQNLFNNNLLGIFFNGLPKFMTILSKNGKNKNKQKGFLET